MQETAVSRVTSDELSERKLSKPYAILFLCFVATFICYLDRVSVSVAVLPMQKALGWTETVKGIVLAAFFIGYLVFQIPSGYLANRLGAGRVLGFAVAWWSLCTMLTPWATTQSFPVLIAVRIAMGAGEAAMFPAAYALLATMISPSERSRAVSAVLGGVPLGTLFALSVSGWVIATFDWQTLFYASAVPGLAWSIVWYLTLRSSTRHRQTRSTQRSFHANHVGVRDNSAPGSVPWKRILTQRAVWALVINHFCSNWTLYMLMSWLPSYIENVLGKPASVAGLFSAGPWLSMFVVANGCAWVADAFIKRRVKLLTVRKVAEVAGLLGSAGFLLLASSASTSAQTMALLCLALGSLGLTWSGFLPNHLEIAPRYAGVLMSLTNTVATLPGIIGVALTGWIVDVSGTYTMAFAIAAAINLFGSVIWIAFAKAEPVVV